MSTAADNEARAKAAIRERMESIGSPEPAIRFFLRQFDKLTKGHRGLIPLKDIEQLDEIPASSTLAQYVGAGKQALSKALMIKLNGGLGTSMGLEGAKSLLPVKDGRTFLDLVIDQVEHMRRESACRLPLLLMNSFSTDADTLNALKQHPSLAAGQPGLPPTFVQHRVPKLRQDNFLPVAWPEDPQREWCPPGHGDIYLALVTSGLLERLIREGFEYAFVSNTDNLGATLDLAILGYLAERHLPFLMEVTERTEADRKGGHIARTRDGRLVLRELAQCPEDEKDDFQDISHHRFFNTNNLWINLYALQLKLEENEGTINLPLIVNSKRVNPTDPDSTPVFQLESAMGAAIEIFEGAGAVVVPRTRFSPVKTTDDLIGLWSDAYIRTPDGRVTLHPDRKGKPVVSRLDARFYGAYADFAARFPEGAPSLRECESLTIEGDFLFGRNIRCRRRVKLVNNGPSQQRVPDGSQPGEENS